MSNAGNPINERWLLSQRSTLNVCCPFKGKFC